MKKLNIVGAGVLCAVVLSLAVILMVFVSPVRAEDTGSQTEEEEYKYAVTIEFGSMTFCYDYGSWDVNEMRYKTSDASVNPANGTVQGYPGWYGFDGIANMISVKYTNGNESDSPTQNRNLSVSLDYRALTSSEGGVVDGVSMSYFSDREMTVPFSQNFKVPHTPIEDASAKTIVYVSLSGKPTIGGNRYTSDSFAPIGMLTIRVGEISD